jgi:hypothetical protein
VKHAEVGTYQLDKGVGLISHINCKDMLVQRSYVARRPLNGLASKDDRYTERRAPCVFFFHFKKTVAYVRLRIIIILWNIANVLRPSYISYSTGVGSIEDDTVDSP